MIQAMPIVGPGHYPNLRTGRLFGAGRAGPTAVRQTFREDFDTGVGIEILTESLADGSRKATKWAFHGHFHGFAGLFLQGKSRILSKLQF